MLLSYDPDRTIVISISRARLPAVAPFLLRLHISIFNESFDRGMNRSFSTIAGFLQTVTGLNFITKGGYP